MREIVLDTETTGLDPNAGHRLVEIACVEILNFVPTGATFHAYINPERDMPLEAFNIHGLSVDFLRPKPLFAEVAQPFLEFIGDSKLVIHNAEFDMRFINFELARAELPAINTSQVFDTLGLARRKHPGASNSLDALCARYKINNSKRTKHGALLDSELLAEVYAELMGGRQTSMTLARPVVSTSLPISAQPRRERPVELASLLGDEDKERHIAFLASFKDGALWLDYLTG